MRWVTLGLVLSACGCDGNPPVLVVELRTDYRPGIEFVEARTLLSGASAEPSEQTLTVDSTAPALDGIRLGEFSPTSTQAWTVTVELIGQNDGVLASSRARVVAGDQGRAVTMLITRDCRNIACEDEEEVCVGARCVALECTPETPEQCPAPACEAHSDCEATGLADCALPRCASGTCLAGGDDTTCGDEQYCQPDTGCVDLNGPTATNTVPVLDIDTSVSHTCALLEGGDVYCWGSNGRGQLGIGTMGETLGPTRWPLPGPARSIGVNSNNTCAALVDGRVFCAGDNSFRQTGPNGALGAQSTPVEVPGVTNALEAQAGDRHSCALTNDGRVFCWGNNQFGQLGDGSAVIDSETPVEVQGLDVVTQLAVGGLHTCALSETGTIYCWGSNQSGQLGDGSTDDRSVASLVASLGADRVVVSRSHTCAIDNSDRLWCWGSNLSWQLADGTRDDRSSPVRWDDRNADAVAVAFNTTCALEGTSVVCAGSNAMGQAGTGMFGGDTTTPMPVIGLDSALSIHAGGGTFCVRRVDAAPLCWGQNDAQQLGDGTTDPRATPTEVLGLP